MTGIDHNHSLDPSASTSTNTLPFRRASTPAEVHGYQHDRSHTSPGRRRQTIAAETHRVSAIYQATHPEEEDLHPVDLLDIHNASMRRAARELLSATNMRSRQLVVDLQYQRSSYFEGSSEDELENDYDDEDSEIETEGHDDDTSGVHSMFTVKPSAQNSDVETTPLLLLPTLETRGSASGGIKSRRRRPPTGWISTFFQQASAVAVVALLNIMVSIPFGASYFPIGWRADGSDQTEVDEGDLNGSFPLPGKQALGIRMFLFATIMGQLAFTFASKFDNPIGLQMVENVPFLHALCHTVIQNQGYGKEALSTLFFLFGVSSVLVGMTFYLLGKWKLGRIVYFFPNHVLVGCIGGIGVFIVITAIEVTSDVTFTFDIDGMWGLVQHFRLLSVVLGFEIVLRFLQHMTKDKNGNAKYPLLSPVYYCLITPLFYLGLTLSGISMDQASEQGYFFPAIVMEDGDPAASIWQDPHLWDIFQVMDLTSISFTAVFQSMGTMIALAAFSLIHVPINIPAFAISTDVGT